MNYLTTTQLRTKTSDMVKSLKNGESTLLVHRSKVIGEIVPKKDEPEPIKAIDSARLMKLAKSLNLPKLTDKEIERRYRAHLMKKYGKSVS